MLIIFPQMPVSYNVELFNEQVNIYFHIFMIMMSIFHILANIVFLSCIKNYCKAEYINTKDFIFVDFHISEYSANSEIYDNVRPFRLNDVYKVRTDV